MRIENLSDLSGHDTMSLTGVVPVAERMEQVLEAFFRDEDDVLLAFLFGSFARGCARPDSDVDVGVLFRKAPDWEVLMEMRDDLAGCVGRDVDLVVLNDVGLVIAMQGLQTGVPVKQDGETFSAFYVRTLNEYEDLKYVRRESEDLILRGRIYD